MQKYEKCQADKSELSNKYIEILEKLTDTIKELQLVEMGMKLADYKVVEAKTETVTTKEPEEKPAISKRNKEIVKLIEQGKSIKEIAETLDLKAETIGSELEHLLKLGMIKARPT